MLHRIACVAAAVVLFACNNKEDAAPAPATAAAVASSTPAAAPAAAKTPPVDKTFTHSKLRFSFSYPDTLTATENPKGVVLESAPIAKVEDRSGKSKTPLEVKLLIRITLEAGTVATVAKKTNPAFAASFPKDEASFKPEKDFAEKIKIAGGDGYRFMMGSHGSNEHDIFLAGSKNETLVIKCSLTSDSQNPTLTELDQLATCEKVLSTLKLKP
jgi:hypothetical protein